MALYLILEGLERGKMRIVKLAGTGIDKGVETKIAVAEGLP